jgi:hypothetical protein
MLMRPKPSPFIASLDSNPIPPSDGQLNFIRYSAEFHFEAPRTAREDGCQAGLFPFLSVFRPHILHALLPR